MDQPECVRHNGELLQLKVEDGQASYGQADGRSDIQHLHRKMLLHSEKQEAEIAAAKNIIREHLNTRIVRHLRYEIRFNKSTSTQHLAETIFGIRSRPKLLCR